MKLATMLVSALLCANVTASFWQDDTEWKQNVIESDLSQEQKTQIIESLDEKGIGKVHFLGMYPPIHPLACIRPNIPTDTDECISVPGLSGTWLLQRCIIICGGGASINYWCEDASACL